MEKILCSAVWFVDKSKNDWSPKNIEEGVVICGRRHANCYQIASMTGLFVNNSFGDYPIVEGFLTVGNLFVDRKMAGDIAYKAGQINQPTELLISENLY